MNQVTHYTLVGPGLQMDCGSTPPTWNQNEGGWVIARQVVSDPGQGMQVVQSLVAAYPTLDHMQFYLAFTPAERIKIKTSANPVVQELWATYQMAVQTDTPIHMDLQSNQDAIAYLAIPATADAPGGGKGPGILTADRVPQVLQGVPQ